MVELISRWLYAVCSRDVNKVLSLYTADAVLLGTFAKEVKQGQELVGYFRRFLSRSELCGEINTCILQETVAGPILSGTYTFWWVGPGGPERAHARFSFVFTAVDGDFLIVNHHSSAVPE